MILILTWSHYNEKLFMGKSRASPYRLSGVETETGIV